MASKVHLLQQAYKQIDSGDYQAAGGILEMLVNVDSVNVEAWEAYMQISRTCNELDDLCDRVLQIAEINLVDRESILDYYCFLREKKKLGRVGDEMQTEIRLEVVDQFSYPLKSKLLCASDNGQIVNFERRLALFLDRAIFVPYIALMAIGFNLLTRNNDLGYWAVLVLMLIAFFGKLTNIFSTIKVNRISPRS